MNMLISKLAGQFAKGNELEKTIRENLKGIGCELLNILNCNKINLSGYSPKKGGQYLF